MGEEEGGGGGRGRGGGREVGEVRDRTWGRRSMGEEEEEEKGWMRGWMSVGWRSEERRVCIGE